MASVDLQAVFNTLKPLIAAYVPPLTAITDEPGRYNACAVGPIEVMGRKRDGMDFATIIVQKAFVGFYFLPVYCNPELLEKLHPDLLKKLKGKACFHIKSADAATLAQIEDALRLGFDEYERRGWMG